MYSCWEMGSEEKFWNQSSGPGFVTLDLINLTLWDAVGQPMALLQYIEMNPTILGSWKNTRLENTPLKNTLENMCFKIQLWKIHWTANGNVAVDPKRREYEKIHIWKIYTLLKKKYTGSAAEDCIEAKKREFGGKGQISYQCKSRIKLGEFWSCWHFGTFGEKFLRF